jgi:hypothetical protein
VRIPLTSILASMAMSVGSGGVAVSETIGDQTTCAEVDAVLDAKPLDYERAAEIYSYINKTLIQTDELFLAQGRASLLKHLAKGDHDNITVVVRVHCDIPNETLQITAIEVYAKIRAEQGDFSE